ncbi:MAG: S41 family peptidase, partial [Myxococcota bacterium]
AAWPAPTPAKGKKADPLPLRSPFDEAPPADLDEPVLRSDLVSVHGAVRQFWRYGAAIGDPTGAAFDDRLLELLSAPLDSTTNGATRALGRLGEALHDGHVFFAATTAPPPAGYLPVTFDHLADRRPVVRWSMIEGLAPGDTITAIDGLSIEAVYEDLLTWNGAATDGYALDLASRQLAELDAPTTYGVVDPDGVAREVTIDPQPYDLYVQTPWEPSLRPSGRLADLGAPDIAFLNLASEVTFDTADALAVIDDAAGATGLVVDMRGYPAISHYEVAAALIDGAFGSPQFLVNDRTGPDLLTVDVEQYPLLGTGAYTGPIVLLVGPGTASAAENFSMMLVGADRVTVVGRRSAGTNGNITGLWMPGGLYFTFTGMEVLFPDGGPFHGIGITPDVEVAPTAADLRDGRDVELEAAIALLR